MAPYKRRLRAIVATAPAAAVICITSGAGPIGTWGRDPVYLSGRLL